MYRSRLGKNLDKRTLDYVSSIGDDSEIAIYDIVGSQAHAIMLYENKILNKAEIKKILQALEKLKKENLKPSSSAEDIHELIEAMVIKKIGLAAGGKMHTARSRNDQVALDIRMKIRDDINTICSCILDLIETLLALAQKHKDTAMPLYTHLQHAQIGTLSHYLLSQADVMFRDYNRLFETFARINQSPLGAGPVGGTSLPINRNSTAKMLGFSGIVENTLDATSSRDVVAEFTSNVAILMTNLSRIAEDLVLWSTSEFSFVELSDQYASPSSVMPQKKNPDILELTRGKTAHVIGNLVAVLSGLKGLASGYGRDLQEIKPVVFSSSKISISALILLNSMFATLRVNKERISKAVDSGYLTALDIAEELVKQGVAFRTAHKVVGNLVQKAHQSSMPLIGLTSSEIARETKDVGIDAKKLRKIITSINSEYSLKHRSSLGSSGYAQQTKMIGNRIGKIRALRINLKKRTAQISSADEQLSRKVQTLMR